MYTNVFDADNIYKNPPQMSCHLSVLLFLIRSLAPPMTQLIGGIFLALVAMRAWFDPVLQDQATSNAGSNGEVFERDYPNRKLLIPSQWTA